MTTKPSSGAEEMVRSVVKAARWDEKQQMKGRYVELTTSYGALLAYIADLERRAEEAEAECERLRNVLRWFLPALEAQHAALGPARDSAEGREYGTWLQRARSALAYPPRDTP